MRDGGGDDVAAPGVLDGHGNAGGDAEVAHQAGLGQAADLADLEVDDVHRAVGEAAGQRVHAGDDLVEDEGQGRAAAGDEAFLIGRAGLLDVDVDVAHGVHDARRLVHGPASVGIGHQHV